jgi:plasmid stability protein
MIRLRNVPDALHRTLKARAAMVGMSLSDYLLAEIREVAERPTLTELRARLHQRKPVTAQLDTAPLVQEERAGRTHAQSPTTDDQRSAPLTGDYPRRLRIRSHRADRLVLIRSILLLSR